MDSKRVNAYITSKISEANATATAPPPRTMASYIEQLSSEEEGSRVGNLSGGVGLKTSNVDNTHMDANHDKDEDKTDSLTQSEEKMQTKGKEKASIVKEGEEGEEERGEGAEENGSPIEEGAALQATIISKLFWPPLPREIEFEIPAEIQEKMNRYGEEYKIHKTMRELKWATQMGVVELELQLQSGVVREFAVSPFHASLINLFSEVDGPLTVEELEGQLGAPLAEIRRGLLYWQSQGVLREVERGSFVTVEDDIGEDSYDFEEEEEEEESGVEESWEVFDGFIMGMLRTYDARPIDKIQSTLKMFVDGYEFSQSELQAHMKVLVEEEKVDTQDGVVYTIHKT